MGSVFPKIDDKIRAWISRQHMFFVATAPLAAGGHINCSPKGGDSLRVIDDHTLIYLETAGSGVETIAHLRENARILIMMCAFDGPPKIYRFHGRGEVLLPTHADFAAYAALFDNDLLGIRSVIRVHVERVSDSCGFGVPLMDFREDRKASRKWSEQHGAQAIRDYVGKKNLASIDGLPGLTPEEAQTVSPVR
jgi:Pyridoxamine 5'-phosphate oxidase